MTLKATTGHTATTSRELSFDAGAVIVQLSQPGPDGTIKGMLQNGKIGLVPMSKLR